MSKDINIRKHFKWILLLGQLMLVAIVGAVSKDAWFSIVISLIGVLFNLLVSYNIGYGFLFGFVYAITNGTAAYYSQVYATFGFMIIMQAPFALYSFYSWQKNKNGSETALKSMTPVKMICMIVFIIGLFFASYFLLKALNGEGRYILLCIQRNGLSIACTSLQNSFHYYIALGLMWNNTLVLSLQFFRRRFIHRCVLCNSFSQLNYWNY